MESNRVIGVDLGGTKILAGLVDRDGGVHETVERPTPLESQEHLLQELEACVEELLGEGVGALGLAVPSVIDQRGGIARGANNIPLREAPLRDRMGRRFGLPVGLENDANAAALAEWRLGAGRGTRDMVVLTLGTGVGGGAVVDGRLFRGWAELGHVVVVADGPPCIGACTGRGHLEALASGTAADAVAEGLYGAGATGHDLVARAREGDERAVEALARIGHYLGVAIGSLVNVFGAELVAVGGGFGTAAAEFLLEPAYQAARREALAPAGPHFRIVPAELGADAGLVGAGLVGFEALDGER